MSESTVDQREIDKFATLAKDWWDIHGPLKTLHDINPARMIFILNHCDLKNKKVLDVGCGGGILTEALAQSGAEVTGLDAEESVIAVASAHAKQWNLPIQYICQPLETYYPCGQSKPEKTEVFDLITCMELLEHVADFSKILENAARLLKKEGLLFLSTINRTAKAYAMAILAAEYIFSILPKQTHDFDKFIRPSELSRALREHGFEVIQLKGLDYNPFTRKAKLSENIAVNYLLVARRL